MVGTSAGQQLSPAEIYAYALAAGFADGEEALTATAIAMAESGGVIDANGDKHLDSVGSLGLWQIYWPAHGTKMLDGEPIDKARLATDPAYNARAAYMVFQDRGGSFQPWTTYWGPNRDRPAYRQFMATAQADVAEHPDTVNEIRSAVEAGGGSAPANAARTTTQSPSQAASSTYSGGSYMSGLDADPTSEGAVEGYGWMRAILQDPELNKLLDDASLGNWTEAKLEAEIRETAWWQKTEPTVRNWQATNGADPALAKQQIDQMAPTITRMASVYGVSITDEQARSIAENSLKFGWDEQGVRNAVLGEASLNPNSTPVGTIGADMGSIKASAASYFMNLSDSQAQSMALRIAKGEITPEGLGVMFANNAKARFSWLAPELDSGFTLAEVFDGHVNQIAQTLEMDPQQVDFAHDSRWLSVLEVPGEKRSMTVSEAARFARNQNEYQYTDDARGKAFSMAQYLEQSFGKRR